MFCFQQVNVKLNTNWEVSIAPSGAHLEYHEWDEPEVQPGEVIILQARHQRGKNKRKSIFRHAIVEVAL